MKPDAAVIDTGLGTPKARDATFRRGVSLGLFVSDRDPAVQRRWYTQFLDEIAALGATDVQLVVRWAQDDVTAVAIAPDPMLTVDDVTLKWVLAQCQARQLRVFVLPVLHIRRRGKSRWRGTLKPSNLEAWWANYTHFIGHYATLSKGRASLLAVGSELISMESQTARWQALIAQIRTQFDGGLTYSANWDHFEPIQFWDALDVVGVTAYQPLSRAKAPTDAELDRGWRPFLGRLRSWAGRKGLRYVFTEVGYPSNPNAAARPWDYRLRGEPALDLQRRCYASLYRTWQGDSWLQGLYVWNWFGEGGLKDRGYTPRGKPAAMVLAHWYRSSAR